MADRDTSSSFDDITSRLMSDTAVEMTQDAILDQMIEDHIDGVQYTETTDGEVFTDYGDARPGMSAASQAERAAANEPARAAAAAESRAIALMRASSPTPPSAAVPAATSGAANGNSWWNSRTSAPGRERGAQAAGTTGAER